MLDSVLSRKEEKRSSWINFGDVFVNEDNDVSEEDVGSRNDEYNVRDSFDADTSLKDVSGSEESAYSGKVSARSHSSEGPTRPPNSDLPPQNRYAWEDSMTVGDRTSRWSGSIYSRMSIMDEEESTDVRDRFVKRVEAMLSEGGKKNTGDATDRNVGVGGATRQTARRDQYIPPVPKIPVEFAGSTRRSEAVPTGGLWNKF
jgi:hypothetical protein